MGVALAGAALLLAGEDGAVLFGSGPQDPDSSFGLAVVALPDLTDDAVTDFAVG